jgi:hypothetical protein
MALKPNFFQAIAALTLAYQAWRYIKRQKSLLEKWNYDILAVRLLGVTKDHLDLQVELELQNPSAVSLTVSSSRWTYILTALRSATPAKKDSTRFRSTVKMCCSSRFGLITKHSDLRWPYLFRK